MAYSSGFTAVTGATYTAAQYNTYTRDNFAAIWIFTTAGDMIYATSATTANRLALTANGILTSGASAPAWVACATAYNFLRRNSAGTAFEAFLQAEKCLAYRSSNYSISSSIAETEIPLNAEAEDGAWHSNSTNPQRITPAASGRYRAFAGVQVTNGSGSNIDSITFRIKTSAGDYVGGCTMIGFVDGAVIYMSIVSYAVEITAGQYFTLVTERSNITAAGINVNANNSWLEVERIR